MFSRILSFLIAHSFAAECSTSSDGTLIYNGNICLRKAVPGVGDSIPAGGGSSGLAIFAYLEGSINFIRGVGLGICILYTIVAGIRYMLSDPGGSGRGEAIEKVKWSIVGLLMLMSLGFILSLLNASFFVQ